MSKFFDYSFQRMRIRTLEFAERNKLLYANRMGKDKQENGNKNTHFKIKP